MNSFIFFGDYAKQIQADALQQAIGQDQTILDNIQVAAVAECVSYLRQKYDVSKAFQPTLQHSPSSTYNAGQTVYLNAPAYDGTRTYALGEQCLQAGFVYSCSTAIVTREAFNSAHWTLLGTQWLAFCAKYPADIFDHLRIYAVGDKVFWNGKVYTCAIKTMVLSHADMLQIGSAGVNMAVNVFPDDSVKGVQYWGGGVIYSVPLSTPISDTIYWAQGDGRDQKLVEICVNIIIYKAHLRIAPRNVPELRMVQYMGYAEDRETRGQRILYPTYCALGWLQAATIGDDITPELPLLQPLQGKRIRFGGNMKNVNNY